MCLNMAILYWTVCMKRISLFAFQSCDHESTIEPFSCGEVVWKLACALKTCCSFGTASVHWTVQHCKIVKEYVHILCCGYFPCRWHTVNVRLISPACQKLLWQMETKGPLSCIINMTGQCYRSRSCFFQVTDVKKKCISFGHSASMIMFEKSIMTQGDDNSKYKHLCDSIVYKLVTKCDDFRCTLVCIMARMLHYMIFHAQQYQKPCLK